MLVGAIGLIMTNSTSFIILYCFRSYEFGGKNIVKRRFRYLVMIQSFVRFSLTFFYYLNFSIVIRVKHILGNLLALSFYYDFYIYLPYFNQSFARFYICSVVTFQVSMTMCSFWILTSYLTENNFFYTLIFLSGLVSTLALN